MDERFSTKSHAKREISRFGPLCPLRPRILSFVVNMGLERSFTVGGTLPFIAMRRSSHEVAS